MWVVGVAYGCESLDVTRSTRNLRFFLCVSTEFSPSTSVCGRNRLRIDDGFDSRKAREKVEEVIGGVMAVGKTAVSGLSVQRRDCH